MTLLLFLQQCSWTQGPVECCPYLRPREVEAQEIQQVVEVRWSLGWLGPRSCLGQGHLCPLPVTQKVIYVSSATDEHGSTEDGCFTIRWSMRKGKWILSETANYRFKKKCYFILFLCVELPFEGWGGGSAGKAQTQIFEQEQQSQPQQTRADFPTLQHSPPNPKNP